MKAIFYFWFTYSIANLYLDDELLSLEALSEEVSQETVPEESLPDAEISMQAIIERLAAAQV